PSLSARGFSLSRRGHGGAGAATELCRGEACFAEPASANPLGTRRTVSCPSDRRLLALGRGERFPTDRGNPDGFLRDGGGQSRPIVGALSVPAHQSSLSPRCFAPRRTAA